MDSLIDVAKRNKKCIKIASLIYSPVTKSLYHENNVAKLEPRLSELIELLIINLNNPVSNNEIIKIIWGSEFISRNVVTNKVGELRAIIKRLSLDCEANEIIVTYPKKGYYIPDGLVSLVDSDILDGDSSETKEEPVTYNRKIGKTKLLLGSFFSIVIISISFIYLSFFYDKDNEETDLNYLYSTRTKLSLNKIYCKNKEVENYLIPLKSMILRTLASNNSIDLANLRSPDYFLQKIDQTCLWPGSKNKDSVYNLSFNLWLGEKNEVNLEAILYYSPSNKVAWRKLYSSPEDAIENIAVNFNSDITYYLKLPKQKITPQYIDMRNIKDGESLDLSRLVELNLSLAEVYFISRELLLKDIESSLIERWISILKVRYPTPEPELHIWISLLTYKIGKAELSLEMLNREYVYEFPDNALISLLKANISLSQGNHERYLINYLFTMLSLTVFHGPKVIFQHFEQGSEPKNCEAIWDKVLSGKGVIISKTIKSNVEVFCSGVEYLPN
ncbi:winged helix-turn-helix domain-containing protein [Vibrio sp. Isolate23]|uniref:winged helix-turn-helix domain-containing protein n=1 Tax=Vibrio sp. Isolate23 TaxID=2908533 RepID=UPI001EFD8C1A|nr:winged helix-turn-helix domain-containing protein [Vibrio sp. Isolate23]MCG9685210.1 winged helix-turn-helix domain-containing protein [Vibrio sp. Isolate23]